MKVKEYIIATVITLIVIAGISFIAIGLMGSYADGPKITVSKKFQYSPEMTDEEILTFVKAKDKVDGDVSDTLIVESRIYLSETNEVVLTFAASNHYHSVTRLTMTVSLDSEEDTQEALEEDSQTESASNGSEKEEESVQNSQTSDNPVRPEAPVVKLTTQEVTLKKGETFSYSSYIAELSDDKDSEQQLSMDVTYEGVPDMNTPGIYEVTYFCIDSDKNISDKVILKVIVQE